jgi:hypothetical protein
MLCELIKQGEYSLYPTKFLIEEIGLNFPKRKVAEILETMGFINKTGFIRKEFIELRKESNRCYLTDKEIVFTERLTTKEKDSLHAQLFNLLVTRVRVFNQAALQKCEASKINLLQNQRRACVSDAYYGCFTAFGSLIEYIKHNHLNELFCEINEKALDDDKEDKRKHFTPEVAEKVCQCFNELICHLEGGNVKLSIDTCDFSSKKLSRKNPFIWIILSSYILNKYLLGKQNCDNDGNLEDIIDSDVLKDQEEGDQSAQVSCISLEQLYKNLILHLFDFVKSIEVESFAIGVSGRENFEENYA